MSKEEKVIRYDCISKDASANSKEKKLPKDRPSLDCSKSKKIIITSIVVPLIITLFLIAYFVYPCLKCKNPEETLIEPEKTTDKPQEDTSNTGDSGRGLNRRYIPYLVWSMPSVPATGRGYAHEVYSLRYLSQQGKSCLAEACLPYLISRCS